MFPFYYLATVTDAEDPDRLGRVRVSRAGDEESVTDWIPVLTPNAGAGEGFFALPAAGTQVLVLVLDSSESRKVVVGGLWEKSARPPETGENRKADLNADGKNSLRFVKTRSGSMFIFDDTEGAEKIQIIAAGGSSRFEFLAAEEKVSLVSEHDVVIEAKGRVRINAREIELKSEKDISADSGEIAVSSEKDLRVQAGRDITVKGSSVALN